MYVVFDIGGVVFEDIWESIFFQKSTGILDLFDLNAQRLNKVCRNYWDRYSVMSPDNNSWETLEVNYWQDILRDIQIPWSIDECIEYSRKFIIKIPGVDDLINLLIENEIQLGICSNQTAFWFERQLVLSKSLKFIDRKNMALSFERGATKGQKDNLLFKVVLNSLNCEPDRIIYIEDRIKHQESARDFGFNVIPFNSDEPNLIDTLKKELGSYGIQL